jgi:hypothetical protein
MATRPPERGQFEATRAWRERYRQQVQAFVRVPFAGRLPAGSIEVSYDADHQVLLFHPTDWQLEIDSSGVEQSYFLRSGNVPSDRSTTLRMIRSGDYISLRSTLMFPFFPADTSIINAFRLARYREFDRARIGQEPTAADSSILYTTTWSLSLPASDARAMEPFWTFVLVFHIPEVTDSSEVSPYPLVVADSAEVWVIDSRSGRLIARVESHRFRLSRRRRE